VNLCSTKLNVKEWQQEQQSQSQQQHWAQLEEEILEWQASFMMVAISCCIVLRAES
jgi:hypothetical protein